MGMRDVEEKKKREKGGITYVRSSILSFSPVGHGLRTFPSQGAHRRLRIGYSIPHLIFFANLFKVCKIIK